MGYSPLAYEVITENMDVWLATLEIVADRKRMNQIREADDDLKTGNKKSIVKKKGLRVIE